MGYEKMSISPPQYYNVNDQVYKLETAHGNLPIATTALIPAVTGKIIRVMGWNFQTNSAANGIVTLKDGATVKYAAYAPQSTSNLVEKQPVIDSGYFECTVSTALNVEVATAQTLVTVFYITYTP